MRVKLTEEDMAALARACEHPAMPDNLKYLAVKIYEENEITLVMESEDDD